MADETILRVGIEFDISALKSGMAEASALSKSELGKLKADYASAAVSVKSAMGSLAEGVRESSENASAAVAELRAQIDGLSRSELTGAAVAAQSAVPATQPPLTLSATPPASVVPPVSNVPVPVRASSPEDAAANDEVAEALSALPPKGYRRSFAVPIRDDRPEGTEALEQQVERAGTSPYTVLSSAAPVQAVQPIAPAEVTPQIAPTPAQQVVQAIPAAEVRTESTPIAEPAPAESKPESQATQFRKQAQLIEESLPPPADTMTRLWRGNRPGEVGTASAFTNELSGIALPFKKAYGGDLSYVDAPTSRLSEFESKYGAAPSAEFHLPDELAKTAQRVPAATSPIESAAPPASEETLRQRTGQAAALTAEPYTVSPFGRVEHIEDPATAAKASVAAAEVALQEPRTRSILGSETRIPVPGESTVYQGRYALREAEEVEPSHNPQTFEANPLYEHRNDRDYTKAEAKARVIQQAQNFDPAYHLSDNPDAVNGPSIVDPRGNVLGGNSRAMALQRAYASENPEAAAAYREMLTAKAPGFGIDPAQVAEMQQPMLVRQLGEVANPQSAITDFNKTGTAALSAAERAVADSHRVSPKTLDYLASKISDEGEEGTLAKVLGGSKGPEVIKRLVDDQVITPQERPQYLDERGLVSPEGKQRVSRLMTGRLFDTSEDYENAAPEVRSKLEKVVGPVARTEGIEGFNITPQVKEGVAIQTEARQRGVRNLDDLRSQQGMFVDRGYSDEGYAIARQLNEPQPKIAGAFRQYASDAEVAERGPGFGFHEPPTRQRAFADAFNQGNVIEPVPGAGVARSEEPVPVQKAAITDVETEFRNAEAERRTEIEQTSVVQKQRDREALDDVRERKELAAESAAPPAAPPPAPPSAPPAGAPPPDDEEEKRRKEAAAREEQLKREKESIENVAATSKEATGKELSDVQSSLSKQAEDVAQTSRIQKSSIEEIGTVQKQTAQTATVDLHEQLAKQKVELDQSVASVSSLEKEMAAIPSANPLGQPNTGLFSAYQGEIDKEIAKQAQLREQVSVTTRAIEEQERAGKVLAEGQSGKAGADTSADKVREAEAAKTGAVAEGEEQRSAAVLTGAATRNAAEKASSQEEISGIEQEEVRAKSSNQARTESARSGAQERAQASRGAASAVIDDDERTRQSAKTVYDQQTQNLRKVGAEMQAHLAELKAAHAAAGERVRVAYEEMASAQQRFGKQAKAGNEEAKEALAGYQYVLTTAKAEQAGLARETDMLSRALMGEANAAREAGGAFGKTATEARIALAGITDSTRAAEFGFARLVAGVKGLGPIIDAAFPIFGALALVEILVDMGEKVYDLYQKYILLKDVQKEVQEASERMAKAGEAATERMYGLEAEHLRHEGKFIEAASKDRESFERKPLDLTQWLKQEQIQKNLSALTKEQQDALQKQFTAVTPSEIPQRIEEFKKLGQAANAAAEQIGRTRGDGAAPPLIPSFSEAVSLSTGQYMIRIQRQQEAVKKIYTDAAAALEKEQRDTMFKRGELEDKAYDAQAHTLIKRTQQDIDILKESGKDSVKAEVAKWQGVLGELHKGTSEYEEVQNKLASLMSRKAAVGPKDQTASLMRKVDQDALAEMRLNAEETGKIREQELSDEADFIRSRLAVETKYLDNMRALRTELLRVEQEQERVRIRKEEQTATVMVTPEGKPDYSAQLNYFNQVATDALAAKNALNEYANAAEHAQKAGGEAIRENNEELKKSVTEGYEAWITESHHTESAIISFWEDIRTRYASDGPLVEEAIRRIAEGTDKLRQETLKLREIEAERQSTQEISGLEMRKLDVEQRYIIHPPTSLNPFGASPEDQQRIEISQIDLQELDVKRRGKQKELDDTRQIFGEEDSAYKKLVSDKEKLDQEYEIKKKALENQALASELAAYRQLSQQITSNFFNGLNQWIQGQKKFSEAMRETWNSIVMDVIKDIEKMGAKWIEEHILMAAVKKLLGIDDTSAQPQQIAKNNTANVAMATSDANMAAAAAFVSAMESLPFPANVAVAPAAAASALATGMTFAAGAAFEKGGIVPEDMIAKVHAKEMVLPERISEHVMATAGSQRVEAPLGASGWSNVYSDIRTLHDQTRTDLQSSIERLSLRTENYKETIAHLASVDREVRTHEEKHVSAAGPYAVGGPHYSFVLGPDGKNYAVTGYVTLNASPVQGDPQATAAKMHVIEASARAPSEMSDADRGVAHTAYTMRHEALRELSASHYKESQQVEPAMPVAYPAMHSVAPSVILPSASLDLFGPQSLGHAVLSSNVAQNFANTRGDTHIHVQSHPTFNGTPNMSKDDFGRMLHAHTEDIGRMVRRESSKFNRY